jgi:aspartate aminotransferase
LRFTSRTFLQPNPIVTLSDKIAKLPKGERELIPLQQGDFSLQTPPEIVEAAADALRQGFTRYAPARGYAQLREAIARKMHDYNGVDCDPESQVLVTQGSTEALYLAASTLLEPGDEAVIPSPYYPPYDSLIRAAGATPRYADSSEERGWLADPSSIEGMITEKTRLILINTPNNPTGAVYPRSYLEEIARVAVDHDLVVLSDEAYEALVFDGAMHVSPTSISSAAENTVGIYSFSKTFAMTGWRLGYLCGPAEFIERAATIHNLVLAHVSSHIQIAGVRALSGWEELTGPIIAEMDARRRLLVDELSKIPGVSCAAPRGAFYVFADFRGAAAGLTSAQLSDRLIEAGVGTAPGTFFGSCGEGYQRLSYAKANKSQILEAVGRIEGVLKQA